jgi:hypothetical protein
MALTFQKCVSHLFLCGLLTILWAPWCAAARASERTIPSDFYPVAQYGPGYSPWKPWTVTITADGKVVQETYLGSGRTVKHTLQLTTDQVLRLVERIAESRFFLLREKYSFAVTDNPTLIIRVTANRASHEVSVYAPRHLRANEEVVSFLRLWNELLWVVPSPNPEQRPQ